MNKVINDVKEIIETYESRGEMHSINKIKSIKMTYTEVGSTEFLQILKTFEVGKIFNIGGTNVVVTKIDFNDNTQYIKNEYGTINFERTAGNYDVTICFDSVKSLGG